MGNKIGDPSRLGRRSDCWIRNPSLAEMCVGPGWLPFSKFNYYVHASLVPCSNYDPVYFAFTRRSACDQGVLAVFETVERVPPAAKGCCLNLRSRRSVAQHEIHIFEWGRIGIGEAPGKRPV